MEVDASLISNDEESDQEEDQQTDMDTDDEFEQTDQDPRPRSFNLDGPTTMDVEHLPNIITDEED